MVDKYSERINQPTSNGGKYSIAYFQDSSGNRTTKDKATKIEILEFDAEDNVIFRTYLTNA